MERAERVEVRQGDLDAADDLPAQNAGDDRRPQLRRALCGPAGDEARLRIRPAEV